MMKVELKDNQQKPKTVTYQHGNGANSPPAAQLLEKQNISQQDFNFSSEIDKIIGGVRTARTAINFVKDRKLSNDRNQTSTNFPSIRMKSLSPIRGQNQPLRKEQEKLNQNMTNKGKIYKTQQYQNLMQLQQQNNDKEQLKKQSDLKQNEKFTNTELIKNVTNVSQNANNLLDILEHHKEREKFTFELIEKMKSKEFLIAQNDRVNNINKLFDKFFVEILLKDGQNKDINREITQIIGSEIQTITQYYDKYINNQEENFKKLNIFQDKEIILITDFYDALKVLMDTYNYYFKELEVYGKTKQEYNVYIKSLYQFKSILKTDPKNQKAFQLKKLFLNQETIKFKKSL